MFEISKIKKLLKPRKDFVEKIKVAYLTVFDAAHPEGARASATPSRNHFTIFAKALVACAALIAIFAGMSVYADTANVAADSPLYPLKRLGENVQLAVAPPAEKAQLQATFTLRRADEIADLEARKPTSTIIAGLNQDFNADINTSLDDAQQANLGDGQLNAVCEKVLAAIATSSSIGSRGNFAFRIGGALNNSSGTVSLDFENREKIVARLMSQCDVASSTVTDSVSATSTVNATSTGGKNLHIIFLTGPRYRHFPNGAPTSTSTSTITGTSTLLIPGDEIATSTATTTVTATTTLPGGHILWNWLYGNQPGTNTINIQVHAPGFPDRGGGHL